MVKIVLCSKSMEYGSGAAWRNTGMEGIFKRAEKPNLILLLRGTPFVLSWECVCLCVLEILNEPFRLQLAGGYKILQTHHGNLS